MSATKLTEAQKRAIREARENGGVFCPSLEIRDELIANHLAVRAGYTVYPDWKTVLRLTSKGWDVEVGDE